ncbi:hypothetical protein [Cohnella silvisoli]|uniref:Peptidase M10 metallopeptidase domain-containing protein n=1 Tax=Cohnella silvisoli TaxID=2873699 RepID=A0ABV1KMB8_9BACL|nr:hypothetical protein [Cohnella silvisoli]MCD9020573.1 hypothetical protein [Cohnella silvisoli]
MNCSETPRKMMYDYRFFENGKKAGQLFYIKKMEGYSMYKKLSMSLLLTLGLFMAYVSSASALVNYGSVSGWMAQTGVDKIGFFGPSDIKLYLTKNSNWAMSDADFSTYVTHALSTWSSVTNKTSSTGTSSNYVMGFGGIGRSDADSLGYPSNALGATAWTSSTQYGYGTAYSGTVSFNVYSISRSFAHMIWDTSGVGQTSNLTANAWKNVFAHEHGHGLGYSGHSANSTKDLMWESTLSYTDWGTIGPTTYDQGHMNIVY